MLSEVETARVLVIAMRYFTPWSELVECNCYIPRDQNTKYTF